MFSNNFEDTPANVLPPRYNHAQTPAILRMIYYAHTATRSDGSPDPDQSHWQLLDDHLNHVAAAPRTPIR